MFASRQRSDGPQIFLVPHFCLTAIRLRLELAEQLERLERKLLDGLAEIPDVQAGR
jgi:hypothetical protein